MYHSGDKSKYHYHQPGWWPLLRFELVVAGKYFKISMYVRKYLPSSPRGLFSSPRAPGEVHSPNLSPCPNLSPWPEWGACVCVLLRAVWVKHAPLLHRDGRGGRMRATVGPDGSTQSSEGYSAQDVTATETFRNTVKDTQTSTGKTFKDAEPP